MKYSLRSLMIVMLLKLPEVRVGPYENPAIAEKDAENFRAFFAALLANLKGA